MNPLSEEATPRSFPKKGVLRERFENEKDSVIDSMMSKGESWAKKVGNGNSGVLLDDIPRLIDSLGLKLVDKTKVCVDKQIYESMKAISAVALTEPNKLSWEE